MKTYPYPKQRVTIVSYQFTMFVAIILTCSSVIAQDSKIKFSGFGEVVGTTSFGPLANEKQEHLSEMFPSHKEGHHKLKPNQFRLEIPGFDLIATSRLSENLSSVAELNFSDDESNIAIQLLQMQIQYTINEKFNLRAGKYLTPIGYLNLNQRHLGYLNYSFLIRDMVHDHLGYVPTTMVGLQVYGKFISDALVYEYKFAIGKNRGFLPSSSVISSTFIKMPGFVLSNELKKSIGNLDFAIGLSGYFNTEIEIPYLDSLGKEGIIHEDGNHDETDSTENPHILLTEIGFTPYVKIDNDKFQLLAEYHLINFSHVSEHDEDHDHKHIEDYMYSALSAQLMLKLNLRKKPFYPYIRYDMANLDNGGYYYGLELGEESHDEVSRVYRPDKSIVMIGAAWDILPFNRIKLEYSHKLDGDGLQSSINFATSFAF